MKIVFSERVFWFIQRISAITNLILLFWFFISIQGFNILDYNETKEWVKKDYNTILILLTFSSITLHASMGVSVIIDDYIHSNYKRKIIYFKNFTAVIFLIILGFCLYLI